MSTTVRHAFGDMSSLGTGKFAAALFTSTPGRPNAVFGRVERARRCSSASRMSHGTAMTSAPRASIAARPASRCSSLRLAITIDAPARANSMAIALPRPVPPPVTNDSHAVERAGGSALAPTGGGAGSPIISVMVVAQLPV